MAGTVNSGLICRRPISTTTRIETLRREIVMDDILKLSQTYIHYNKD